MSPVHSPARGLGVFGAALPTTASARSLPSSGDGGMRLAAVPAGVTRFGGGDAGGAGAVLAASVASLATMNWGDIDAETSPSPTAASPRMAPPPPPPPLPPPQQQQQQHVEAPPKKKGSLSAGAAEFVPTWATS